MELILSVVLVTHNRSAYLTKALESLAAQTLSSDCFEVIVVDNMSTDDTKQTVQEYSAKIKNLVYEFQPTTNLNEGRNTGWKASMGRYIAYTDDDAVVSPNWLECLCTDFSKHNPDAIGGRIIPIWEAPRPAWLHDRLLGALSLVDYAPQAFFTHDKLPFGVNVAFSKNVLQQVGGFDPRLDRQGGKLLSGGETALLKRILNKGGRIYYDPNILVKHHIQPGRLQQSWFLKRYYWGGYSDALTWRILNEPSFTSWMKKLAYYIYGFLRNPLHITWLWRSTTNPDKFWFKCTVHARIGYIAGLFDTNK